MLDTSKLTNIRKSSQYFDCACPACRILDGRDKKGVHLRVWNNGKFHCAAYPNDKLHNRAIFQLAGINSSGIIDFHYEEPTPQLPKFYDEDILKRLIRDTEYWENRGIRKETVLKFEGGITNTGKLNNRYCFPMRDINNRIVGFSGRFLTKANERTPRWKILGHKKETVFNWKNIENIVNEKKNIILVEGIGDILALADIDIYNALPIFGIRPSSKIISALLGIRGLNIVISLNNENSGIGNEAAQDIKQNLSSLFDEEKIKICLPSAKDWLEIEREKRLDFAKEIALN